MPSGQPCRSRPTPRLAGVARSVCLLAAVLALPAGLSGCMLMRPSNTRDWTPDQAALPYAEVRDDVATVHNVRNCDYRSEADFTVRYYDKTLDLRELNSVYFVVVPFPDMPSLAHTMMSFGFADRDFLGVSVEVRREKGETYNPVLAMFNQYELTYVLADERDLIGLRSNHRLNDVYLYRAKATPDQVRSLFLDVMTRVNKLARQPEFYNTLTNNCTTNIVRHVNHLAPHKVPMDYRVLLPGYSDRLAYDLGLLDTPLSYAEAREQARVTRQAYLYRDSASFSQDIRRR
jgi:hypothetical protein